MAIRIFTSMLRMLVNILSLFTSISQNNFHLFKVSNAKYSKNLKGRKRGNKFNGPSGTC